MGPKSGHSHVVGNCSKSDSGRTRSRKAVREGGPCDWDGGRWRGRGGGEGRAGQPDCISTEPRPIGEGGSHVCAHSANTRSLVEPDGNNMICCNGGSLMYKVYLLMAQIVFNCVCVFLFINEEKL